MTIRGFILGVLLVALVGWCMVQESIIQTRARYELAELSRREQQLRVDLDKLLAEEQNLRSPFRLTALLREKKLDLVALSSATPNGAGLAQARRPGQVMDQEFSSLGESVGERQSELALSW